MKRKNQYIPDFGELNKFFDEDISPEEFMDNLTDIIEEYSTLALMFNDQVAPRQTAFRIALLAGLHREMRRAVR